MESFQIQVDYEMNEDDAAVISKGLGEFNTPFFGHKKSLSFALYLRDENQQIVGGILAWMRPGIQLLCIDTIWVAEHLRHRGFGKQLMLAAENEGLKNGCTHAQLETLPFQAELFSLEKIIELVCDKLKVSLSEVQSNKRDRQLVQARAVMALLTTHSRASSLSALGRKILRDPTSLAKLAKKAKNDHDIKSLCEEIIVQLTTSCECS
jgi:GNAT superfamily N-acetyltransferase